MAKSIPLKNRAAAELIGTLFFVFLAAGSVVSANLLGISGGMALLFIALTTGLALALGVSLTMGVSGGNLNPAVTIGLLAAKKISAHDAAVYIVAQIVGATIGAALLLLLFPVATGAQVFWGTPTLGTYVGIPQAIIVEAVLTFMLLLAVFGTAVDPRAPKIGGFGIGLTVAADALVGGQITGAAMNPARALGPAIVSMHFTAFYVYIIGPVIGAVLAALIYERFIMRR